MSGHGESDAIASNHLRYIDGALMGSSSEDDARRSTVCSSGSANDMLAASFGPGTPMILTLIPRISGT